MEKNMGHFYLWVMGFSINIIFSTSIHLLANSMTSFFFTAEQHPVIYKYHIFIIHSSVEGYLGWFHFLAIVKRAVINMVEQVSMEQGVENFGYLPGSGIAALDGRFIFRFLRVLDIDFQSGYTSFKPDHQEMWVPLSCMFSQAFVIAYFLALVHSGGAKMKLQSRFYNISLFPRMVNTFQIFLSYFHIFF